MGAFDHDIISMCCGLLALGQVQIRSVEDADNSVQQLTPFLVEDANDLARPPQLKYVIQITVWFLEIIHKLRWETEDTIEKLLQTGAQAILCLGNTDADAPYCKF